MGRRDDNQTQPLLSGSQHMSLGDFGVTNLSADRLVFTPDFAISVYSAIYDNSYGRTTTTPENKVGEHLAFFPELCMSLRTQMEALRYDQDGKSIKDFLTYLRRMNLSIQVQNKKNIESDNTAMQPFTTQFDEQVKRIFSYLSALYLNLRQDIQRVLQDAVTPFTQNEIGEFASVNQAQRERNEYCTSNLQVPEKLFMPAIALDVYEKWINFSRQKLSAYLYAESAAVTIRDQIENASTLDHYISLISTITQLQIGSSDSDYGNLLKTIAEQIGEYINMTRPDIVALLNQQFNSVKNDLDAKRAEACSQCGKAAGCCCLSLLAHPAYSVFAFISPVVAASSWSLPFILTFGVVGEIFGVLACAKTLPKSREYGRLFCQASDEANQLNNDFSKIASAKAVVTPNSREMS